MTGYLFYFAMAVNSIILSMSQLICFVLVKLPQANELISYSVRIKLQKEISSPDTRRWIRKIVRYARYALGGKESLRVRVYLIERYYWIGEQAQSQ